MQCLLIQGVLDNNPELIISQVVYGGANVNGKTEDGSTALHLAVKAGKLEAIQILLSMDADINLKDDCGRTPLDLAADPLTVDLLDVNDSFRNEWMMAEEYSDLRPINGLERSGIGSALHWAGRGGALEAIETLLQNGAEKDGLDWVHGNPGAWAAESGHLLAVQLIHASGGDLYGALHKAAKGGHTHVIQWLLDNGVDKDSSFGYGISALQVAAYYGQLPALSILLSRGASTNSGGNWTDITSAANGGRIDTISFLLDQGADINSTDGYGMTALTAAANEGHINVICHLLEKGVDIESMDEDGRTALTSAASNGQIDVINYLLDKGVETNSVDGSGMTALISAATRRQVEVIRHLLFNKGANPHFVDINKQTTLHHAAFFNNAAVINLLLDQGIDPNIQDKEGKTALHIAALQKNIGVINALLDRGADPNIIDYYTQTPLAQAAISWGDNTDVINLLIYRGACG